MNRAVVCAAAIVFVAGLATGCDRDKPEGKVNIENFEDPSEKGTSSESTLTGETESPDRAEARDGAERDRTASQHEDDEKTAKTEIKVLGVENDRSSEEGADGEPSNARAESDDPNDENNSGETSGSSDRKPPRPRIEKPIVDDLQQVPIRPQALPEKLGSGGTSGSGESPGGSGGATP